VPETVPYGTTAYIPVPLLNAPTSDRLHWLVPPSEDRCLTAFSLLRDALRTVPEGEADPSEEARS
jgi:hypothetical protein